MKKLIYLLLLPLALAVAACGGKNGSSNKESVLARQDSVDAHGLQRMQSSKAETDIKFKGRDYHSLVSRTPDESLPHVSNEMGDTYVDNKIVLRITREVKRTQQDIYEERLFIGSRREIPFKIHT